MKPHAGAFVHAAVLAAVSCAVAQFPEPFSAGSGDAERFGYKNAKNAVVIEPRFRIAEPFTPEGLASAVDDSGWVLIDVAGRPLIRPYVFDNGPDPFVEDLAR